MESFEYLSVLISIVLGLGITQLLLGFGRWLEQRKTMAAYAPAIVWAIVLVLSHVQTWWSMYGLRGYEDWFFLQFSFVLLQPITLFLLSTLVFPSPTAPQQDLRANFFEQRPWFFALLMVLLVVSILKDLVRTGSLPSPLNLGFHAVLFLIGVVGFVTNRESAQRWLAYAGLLVLLLYIAALFAVI